MRSILSLTTLLIAMAPAQAETVDYLKQVKPLLAERCVPCHGVIAQKAKLRLDTAQAMRKGGRNGPAIVPGKGGESLLIEAVLGKGRGRMPPEKDGAALSAEQIALLTKWIDQGARAPVNEPVPEDPRKHWAFQPVRRPALPGGETGNPVDAFLSGARARLKVQANARADRATLLRRVHLDLVGIPPTREALQAFLNDHAPDAYERVVDQLLASPQYGERWGRHWMDVWRYSDPFGLGEEYRYSQRHIWRWRDWIIESLNADKGYDRMIVEMLAGDEVAPGEPEVLRATGFLARNWYKFNRNVWLQDTVEYTAAGFLGITLKCARCHDHKYDPISQKEYYQFRAFFEPHDVRIDPLPGQSDPLKDGVARSFDAKPDAPTYLFLRGDERTPDSSRSLTSAVPPVLGESPSIVPVRFSPRDLASALPRYVAAARTQARADLTLAEAEARRAEEVRNEAQTLLADLVRGVKPKSISPVPIVQDEFKTRSDVWRVVSGEWSWEPGRLVNRKPGSFLTVSTTRELPINLTGRIRYVTTGGSLGSVGISYDVHGTSFQAIYLNPGPNSAARAFHRVNGVDTYPAEGVVTHPVSFKQEVTLDFAVRGDLLNTWVNGQLRNVYRLPVARRAGTFSVWTHEATAEFREVRLAALGDHVVLAAKPGEAVTSPWAGPAVLTREQAEAALKNAASQLEMARRKREVALAGQAALEARILADEAQVQEKPEQRVALAKQAAASERRLATLRAQVELFAAEQALRTIRQTATGDAGKKQVAAAEQKLLTARKAKDAALASEKQTGDRYTSLVQLTPAVSTGRRLALARWMSHRQNPLTARVAVNHVWMRHFGTALVPSVANFGLAGKRPTHPELLDWLAAEFMESGWKFKKLHRLLVTSQAYQASSLPQPSAMRADPNNQTYWRMNPRRMEAEVVRDSVLKVAGHLDPTQGGPILDETLGQTSPRRSVYFRLNAEYRMQFLDQFDLASTSECFQRTESVIPQQALALSNSPLAINQSRALAGALAKAFADNGAFVNAAFEQVLTRQPTPTERQRCLVFLSEQAKLFATGKLTAFPAIREAVSPPAQDPAQRAREDLILVLFNHNDFVTIR